MLTDETKRKIAEMAERKFEEIMPSTAKLFQQCDRDREFLAEDMNTAFLSAFIHAFLWFCDEDSASVEESELKIAIQKARFHGIKKCGLTDD